MIFILLLFICTITQSAAASFVPESFVTNSKTYTLKTQKHHPFIVHSTIIQSFHINKTKPPSRRKIYHQKTSDTTSSSTSLGATISSSTVSMLVDAAYIGAGAVAGSLCRWQVGILFNRAIEKSQPRFAYYQGWHTAGINILGSFILGSLAGIPTVDSAAASIENHRGITARTRLMAGVGFCGSFTTFSTFSVDVVAMLTKGEMGRALSYMAVNNLGGVFAAFTGFSLARRIIGK